MNLSFIVTAICTQSVLTLSFSNNKVNAFTRQSTQLNLNQLISAYSKGFTESEYANLPLSNNPSELPSSFQDAVDRAATITLTCFSAGKSKCRIDFDTSIGDMTYTSLKNTLPMVKELVIQLADKMNIERIKKSYSMNDEVEPAITASTQTIVPPGTVEIKTSTTSSTDATVTSVTPTPITKSKRDLAKELSDEINKDVTDTIRLIFPDMGAAALARRDWKMGTFESEVPFCVQTANIQNDVVAKADKVVIILCPLYSETDYVERILDLCAVQDTPCIMINPELINMDQGFGVKARRIRKDILNVFTTSYKLKTLKNGALVREWPRGFTAWCEDETDESGYKLLRAYEEDPPREAVNELFDEALPPVDESKNGGTNLAVAIAASVTSFFKGMSKL